MSNSNPPWRQATRAEIKQYYEDEFPRYIDHIPEWITPNAPKQFAIAFPERFPATRGGDNIPPKDFVRRDTRGDDGEIYIDSWDDLIEFIQHPAANDPMRINTGYAGLADPDVVTDQQSPVPSAVYYGLDNHEQFWVLAFDIDAKDVAKQNIAEPGESFDDITDERVDNAGVYEDAPGPSVRPATGDTDPSEGGDADTDQTDSEASQPSLKTYGYRYEDLQQSIDYAFELQTWLEDTVGFSEVRIFYSGQGAHVYAFENDPYYEFTKQSRRFVAEYIQERVGIPIDKQITPDQQRVIRLPYSLHTDVSRIVTEIHAPEFDFRTDPVPEFLSSTTENGDQK